MFSIMNINFYMYLVNLEMSDFFIENATCIFILGWRE